MAHLNLDGYTVRPYLIEIECFDQAYLFTSSGPDSGANTGIPVDLFYERFVDSFTPVQYGEWDEFWFCDNMTRWHEAC